MTQKTIKASYKQPVNYKLIRDGYKTINGVINAQDGMPTTLNLPTPSETYVTDLQYTVHTDVDGAPVLNFSSFTLPDNELCESKQYCYALRGMDYNYITKQTVRYYDNFTIVGTPVISNTGVAIAFSDNNYLKTDNVTINQNDDFEMAVRFYIEQSSSYYSFAIGSSEFEKLQIGYSNGVNPVVNVAFNDGNSFIGIGDSYTLSLNTYYTLKVKRESGILSVYIKSNGDYVFINSAPSTGIYSGIYYIGKNSSSEHYVKGNIDLSQTYIKVNNQYCWLPYRDVTNDVLIQIPGILDPSVVNDDWQQNQNYKLYQIKTQNNLNTLQLTENNITNNNQKYNQYVNQITIPARDYKWYYHGIPEGYYEQFGFNGNVTIRDRIATFEDGTLYFHIFPRSYYSPFTTVMQFETSNVISNESLLEIVNEYNNTLNNQYEQKCIYFSCIHNGKFSIANDQSLSSFNEGTVLLPNTKYWLAIYLNQSNVETYLLVDDNYSKYSLPQLSSWIKQTTINFSSMIDIVDNEWTFGNYIDYNQEGITYFPFTGKLYLEDCIAFDGLTTSYDNLTWEAYYYYNYEYKWIANKSIYDYDRNSQSADVLDFSKSYINVSKYTYNQYKNPNVCLMPIDGGETITQYSANGTQFGGVKFNKYTGELSNFSSTAYLKLPNAFMPKNNSWEIKLKVKTPNSRNEMHYLLGSLDSYYWTIGGELTVDNTFAFGITSSGDSWNIAWLAGQTIVLQDTWYWIKLSFDGIDYKFELSDDGINYTLENSITDSTPIYQNSTNSIIHLGTQATGYTYWTGEIDLKECQIKIDNHIWWNGIKSSEIKNHVYKQEIIETIDYSDYSNLPTTLIDGTNFIISEDVIMNGSASCYVANGRSFGYFVYTPNENKTISITAYTDSESGYDYGACFIGTQLYDANRNQIINQTPNEYGSWIFLKSGATSEETYTYNLIANTTYYIQFYYTKDGSVDSGNDRIYITRLENFIVNNSFTEYMPGCLYNYNDNGQQHDFDVYYNIDCTQPMLVDSSQNYSNGIKVDTISIPQHEIWTYQSGGVWTKIVS